MATTVDEKYCHLKACKPVIVLNKFRSPHLTEYYEDPEDDWFFFVMTKAKKKNEFTHCSIVIRKDVAGWVRYATSQGWKVELNETDLLEEETNNTNSNG